MRRFLAIPVAIAGGLLGLLALGKRRVAAFETLSEGDVRSGHVARLSDADLHYVDRGSGPPLLLIHGLGASLFTFRKNVDDLAQRFRVIAVDLGGFGGSSRELADYSQTVHARRLVELLDRLGIDRASVLGHSMGGSIAMRLAATYPARVERLVLVAPASPDDMRRAAWLTSLLAPLFPLAALVYYTRRVRERTLRTAFHDPSRMDEEVFQSYWRPARVRGHLRALSRLMADRRRDLPVDLSAIQAPALILWGASDTWLRPSRGEALRRSIPDSRLVVVPEAGHLLPEEQSVVFSRLVTEFLAETPAPAGSRKAT